MTNAKLLSAQPVALAIGGMHCAACVARIEQALRALPGVTGATVSLVTGRADIVVGSDGAVSPEVMVAAIARAGYRAVPWQRRAALERQTGKLRLGVCMLASLALVAGTAAALRHDPAAAWALLALASLVQFWGGWPFYRGAFAALRARAITMDVLVAFGSTIAYGISAWRVYAGHGKLMFEASALSITFLLVGRWLETRARHQAVAAVHHLVTLQPQQVRRLDSGRTVMTALADIKAGDRLEVWTGERVPLDGAVVAGEGAFDFALVTGEAAARQLGTDDAVVAGALCLAGQVTVEVSSVAGQTMIDRMADMVAMAQASKSPFQRMTDTVASYFVFAVILTAILALALWSGLRGDVDMGVSSALAVLLLACPCALGLAVPMVVAVAIGQAARYGILIRDATALERAAQVTTVVFDKTGTLSLGKPDLAETVALGDVSGDQVLACAAALNQRVNHPLAEAMRAIAAARSAAGAVPAVQGMPTIVPGRGVRGVMQDGRTMICGNLQFMNENHVPLEEAAATAAAWEEHGRSMVWLAELTPAPRLLGVLSFRDGLRPEAQDAVSALQHGRYNLAVLSGDNKLHTLSVAKRLGIGQTKGEVLPQEKLHEIQKRQKWGDVVAMVGDGMNDAPALAAADLGIAMSNGVAAADAAAPVRLLRDDLRLVPALFGLAKMAHGLMLTNIVWAVAFNAVALPLAVMGRVPPHYAALSMGISSLAVVGMALTLKWWRPHGSKAG